MMFLPSNLRSISRGFSLFICVLLLFSAPAWGRSFSQQDMRTIWRSNGSAEGLQKFSYGSVNWDTGMVFISGRGSLNPSSGANSRLMARRAAMVDMYRNTISLLFELKYGLPDKIESIKIEGYVKPGPDIYERLAGNSYILESRMPLSKLLEDNIIWKSDVR